MTEAEDQLFPGTSAMSKRFVVAIDGGGTATRAGLYDESGMLVAESTGELSNPCQRSIDESAEFVADLALSLLRQNDGELSLIIAGISGARKASVRDTFARTLCERTKAARVIVTTDIHAQLLGNANHTALAVISGTGSSVAAKDVNDQVTLFGGRGPRLGDDGSAYDLVITALRAAYRWQDQHGESPALLSEIERAAHADSDDGLVAWSVNAKKNEIAALATKVVELAEAGDTLAIESVQLAAGALAAVTTSAANRIQVGRNTPIFVSGGMFENSPFYRKAFEEALRASGIQNKILLAPRIGHRAVFELARQVPLPECVPHTDVTPASLNKMELMSANPLPDDDAPGGDSIPLECLSSVEIVARMHQGDEKAAEAVAHCSAELALLINRVVVAFRKGGRLIYVGAGTSGRLGVLDASECPPTFGVPPGQVIGIIAGGERALRESIEGAEDDTDAARADMEAIDPPVGRLDVVVGIAASGTTPYTLAALETAKSRGAATALVCCKAPVTADVNHLIALPVGDEPLPGSTRLKAGTATKMVLNAISTGAMALSGRVYEGYMVHVQPTNEKLRKRAVKIIEALTDKTEPDSEALLAEAGNDVAVAVVMHRGQMSVDIARERLARTRGDVRAALALDDGT